MDRARILTLIVGIACLAIGASLGWIAAVQTSRGTGDAAAADTARAQKAAERAAVQAEGWARVANAARTLAKGDNEQAQAARQQAREFAARAEKAASRAAQAEARVQKAQVTAAKTTAAPVAHASATARPRVAAKPAARPRVAERPKARPTHAPATAVASSESCRRAAIFERTAASASASREAAYNASMSGIAVNAHCAEPERSLIGAYLLAQRASAEVALKNGDWKADLSQSDRVLSDCVRHPQRYGPIARGCRQRLTKNAQIRHAAR